MKILNNNKNMKISVYTATSFIVIALVLGVVIGYSLTPEYKMSVYDKSGMDLGAADRTFDLRYINAMISHHRGAMLLAEQLKESTVRPEMASLAEMILTEEPKAIAELYAFKKDWYGDSKKVKDPVVANLGSADDKFDLRFLNALIYHHEEGILMTKEARMKSSRAEILDNVDDVERFLSNSLNDLKQLRFEWYAINF